MIGKVKKWLGIEGVKLELVLPEEVHRVSGVIPGFMRFQSLNPQTVTGIQLKVIERYTRGRGKEKLIDEYELGSLDINRTLDIPANEPVDVDFELPFEIMDSAIDEFGNRNFIFGGVAKLARFMRGAHSEYRVEAEAKVKGVGLSPFDKKPVLIK